MGIRLFFTHNKEEVFYYYSGDGYVPPINSFIRIIDNKENSKLWKVQQITTVIRKIGPAISEPEVEVHLRRLHPGEESNILEPTGYDYI